MNTRLKISYGSSPLNRLAAFTGLAVICSFLMPATANAQYTGFTVEIDYRFPNLQKSLSSAGGPFYPVVGPGNEVSFFGTYGPTVDVSDFNSCSVNILIYYPNGFSLASGNYDFDGLVVTSISPGIPDIIGVTLVGTNISGTFNLSFDANHVYFDQDNLASPFPVGSFISVDVQFCDQCEEDLAIALQLISSLEAQLATANATIAGLQTDLGAANATIAGLQADLDASNTTNAGLQTDLDTANATIAGLQTDLGSANATIAGLQTDLGTANATIAGLQADLGTANATIAGLQADLGTANATIAGLQADLGTANATIATLTQENKALEEELAQLQNIGEEGTATIVSVNDLIADPATPPDAQDKLSEANRYLQTAQAKMAVGDLEEGIKEIEKAIKELQNAADKGADTAALQEALAAAVAARVGAAIDDIAALPQADPSKIAEAQQLMAEGQEFFNEGDFEKAVDAYKTALDKLS